MKMAKTENTCLLSLLTCAHFLAAGADVWGLAGGAAPPPALADVVVAAPVVTGVVLATFHVVKAGVDHLHILLHLHHQGVGPGQLAGAGLDSAHGKGGEKEDGNGYTKNLLLILNTSEE